LKPEILSCAEVGVVQARTRVADKGTRPDVTGRRKPSWQRSEVARVKGGEGKPPQNHRKGSNQQWGKGKLKRKAILKDEKKRGALQGREKRMGKRKGNRYWYGKNACKKNKVR